MRKKYDKIPYYSINVIFGLCSCSVKQDYHGANMCGNKVVRPVLGHSIKQCASCWKIVAMTRENYLPMTYTSVSANKQQGIIIPAFIWLKYSGKLIGFRLKWLTFCRWCCQTHLIIFNPDRPKLTFTVDIYEILNSRRFIYEYILQLIWIYNTYVYVYVYVYIYIYDNCGCISKTAINKMLSRL